MEENNPWKHVEKEILEPKDPACLAIHLNKKAK
jgi:hypothetical protein